MKKHWLYYITPCILASLLALVFTIMGLVDSNYSGDKSVILVFLFLSLSGLLLADLLVKKIIKGNILLIWIIEILMVVIGVMCIPDLRLSGC